MALEMPALTTPQNSCSRPKCSVRGASSRSCSTHGRPLSGLAGPSTLAAHVCSHGHSTSVPVSEGGVEEWRRVSGWKRGRRGCRNPFLEFLAGVAERVR